MSPEDAEAFNNRGLAFDALSDYEGAMNDYAKALDLRLDFAEARSNLGAAQEAMGNWDEALREYLMALEASPEFAAAHYNAARLYSRAGDLDRCLHHLDSAVRLAPQFSSEAEEDENLAWVMKMGMLKKLRESPTGSQPESPAED